VGIALPAAAHQAGEAAASTAWRWSFEPWVVALLAASLVLYALGVRKLWRRAGAGRGITRGQVACFAGGWLVLALSLTSPIDTLGDALFSMHMVQHELMMVVAAPLFVLSRPLEAWTWALSPALRRGLAAIARRAPLAWLWSALTEPVGAWALHAVAIWAWHMPALFSLALVDRTVHGFQHASFLLTALAFWWAVLGRIGRRPDANGLASLFTTMLHTGALGALLTFAPSVWYPHYLAADWPGLTALEDQQLGGLVMWVPAGLAYLAAGLALAARWLIPQPPPRRTAD
jgi:cytochrome c oxidase assembly factor CtaG